MCKGIHLKLHSRCSTIACLHLNVLNISFQVKKYVHIMWTIKPSPENEIRGWLALHTRQLQCIHSWILIINSNELWVSVRFFACLTSLEWIKKNSKLGLTFSQDFTIHILIIFSRYIYQFYFQPTLILIWLDTGVEKTHADSRLSTLIFV